jgi:subtilase family serine protease
MPFSPDSLRSRNLRHRFQARLRLEELEIRNVPSVAPYAPAAIVHAYGVDQVTFNSGKVAGNGAGQTIAIVDAYYDPTIQSDIAKFSTKFNLSQLDGKNGNGLFTVKDLSNKTLSPAGDDWTMETALDVEWAHAVAPKANILLVEAASDGADLAGKPVDLLNAVHTAATTKGVVTVSMSWGQQETAQETSWDSYFTTSGVTFLAASGDGGAGTIWPSVSPNVVSVGGTSLTLTTKNTIASEKGWGNGSLSSYYGGSGGGFSQYEPLPSYQKGITSSGGGYKYTSFGARLSPDVAAVADPNTGVNVLDGADGGWFQVGGTSAATPMWAGIVAIGDQGRALAGAAPLSSAQTLSTIYKNPTAFHDVTKGSTGSYGVYDSFGNLVGIIPVSAQKGYDLVTGQGSPIATAVVNAFVKASSTAAPTTVASTTSGTAAPQLSQKNAHHRMVIAPTGSSILVIQTGTSGSSGAQPATPVVPPPAPVVTAAPASSTAAPILTPFSSGSAEDNSAPGVDDADLNIPVTPDVPGESSETALHDICRMPSTPAASAVTNAVEVVFIDNAKVSEFVRQETVADITRAAADPISLLAVVAALGLAYEPSTKRRKPSSAPSLPA